MRSEGLLSVVIPVYRSEAYLEATVSELVAALAPAGPFEMVLVNDGSPDGVQKVIDSLCDADPRIHGVTVGHNIGQHRATLYGFSFTRGDVVVTVDDDGQNPPAAALAVARELRERDLDVVYGRFDSVEQAPLRRLASRVNRWISRHTLGNVRDLSISNVRAVRGDLARAIAGATSPYPYIDALLFGATQHMAEVPVPHRARARGQSTYRFRTLFKLWVAHLTSLTVLPLRVATAGSFATAVLGFVIGLVELVRVLLERKAPAGWLSLFCAVTFLFSVLFAFLGIISMYLGRLYVTLNARGLVWIRSRTGQLGRVEPPEVGARTRPDGTDGDR